MASLPSQRSWQRRSSPEPEPVNSSSAQGSPTVGTASFVSEDSQTVLINSPEEPSASDNKQTVPTPSRPPQDDEDVKKCWICFADETEDTAETSQWRNPCPCALVAHEDCLLDWIADMESPSSRKRTLGPPQLLCPQCKSQIYLARPRDPVVETVRATERVVSKFVTPVALTLVMSTIVGACGWHGTYTIAKIFGPRDAGRILDPVLSTMFRRERMTPADLFNHWLQHWRVHLGIPLITPMLVLSRTHLADSVLPVLPIVFFATQGDSDEPLDFTQWPPSASMAVAVLPYLRSVYNAYYERIWAPHEKRWLKEIQPRNGQPAASEAEAADANNENNENNQENEDGVFEVRIDGNFWDDWGDADDGNQQGRPQDQQQQGRDQEAEIEEVRDAMFNVEQEGERAPPLEAPPLADDQPAVAPAPNVPRQPQPRRQQRQPVPQAQPQQERRLSISTTGLAEKVLGALIFPLIASSAGAALKLILPSSWVNKPLFRKPTGLLQERWGRSIVGGCLFVVLKDAVMLYVRWKMAQQHRSRRVLDYDRQRKRVVGR